MVASALITRGMNPDEAYKTALTTLKGQDAGNLGSTP